jgi:hypothetical protein
MKCTTCDETLAPGTMFCPNCGARVPAPSSAGAPTTAVPSSYSGSSGSAAPYQPPPVATPYSPPAPQSYQPAQPVYMQVSPPASTSATVSLVFGILAWVILPIIGAVVAIIAGHMARNEIRASGGQLGGAGYATAGLVLGYIQLVLMALACVGIMLVAVLSAAAG